MRPNRATNRRLRSPARLATSAVVIVELQEAHPDWELTAIDNQYRGQVDSVGDVEIDHVDVRNRDRLENALSGADIVFHLAAVSGVDDCEENADLAYEVNVQERITSRGSAGRLGLHSRFRSVWLCLGTPVVPDYRRPAAGSAELVRAHEGDQRAGHRGVRRGCVPGASVLKSNLYGEHVVDGLSSGSRPLSTSLSTGRWLGRHSPSTNLGRRREISFMLLTLHGHTFGVPNGC